VKIEHWRAPKPLEDRRDEPAGRSVRISGRSSGYFAAGRKARNRLLSFTPTPV